jgi:tetratricopeptide (TPR) repeat protein
VLSDYEFDFAGAEKEYKRAFGLNPNLASAHQWYGEMLTELGRFEDGMAEIQRALDLDPLSLIINRVKGRNLVFAGKIDQGIDQLKRAAALDVSFPAPHGDLAMTYQIKGNYAESVEELATQMDLLGDKGSAALARESFSTGGWRGFLLAMTDSSHRSPILNSIDLANFYIALGEKDAAIRALNRAYDERSSDFRSLKVDPRFDPIRGDPRFQELYRTVGLP